MGQVVLDKGTIPFQAEGRLLQELGERLVASPEVALVELIKNAYDADSALCEVRLDEDGKALVIADQGHGMTFEEFVTKWMRIAATRKEQYSRIYRRRVTGAKGIGRFAVRYLGDHLTLITVAEDEGRKLKTKLTAQFDWRQIDQLNDIREAKVVYALERADPDSSPGTSLEVRRLKTSTDFTTASSLRADVLRIVTPLQGLDAGRFRPSHKGSDTDPGFRVLLPGAGEESAGGIDLAEMILRNYWARLAIDLSRKRLIFKVWFSSSREPKTLEIDVPTSISAGFVADIRYFPRRKGVFQAKGVRGQAAWQWVRDNHGVAVVDHGFRVVPYGYKEDDWLHLDLDKSHSERDWRSEIAKREFSIPMAVRNRPADNPALYLPYNYQLVGAVFVESQRPNPAEPGLDLFPSMDREGFLKNQAFEELVSFVRGGIEFLAWQDKRELDRRLTREAREATQRARDDVRKAIEHIQRSPTLTRQDKARLTNVYSRLAEQVEEVEEYNVQARRSLMAMSLLGVVAGFMTHETKSLVFEMEKAAQIVRSLANKNPSLATAAVEIDKRLAAFKGQLQYVQLFLGGVRRNEAAQMSASGQIRHVLKRFENFATDHGIRVSERLLRMCRLLLY